MGCPRLKALFCKRHMTACLEFAKWRLKELWEHEEKITLRKMIWSDERKKSNSSGRISTMSGEHQAPLITRIIPSLQCSMVVAASCFGGASQWQGQETGQNWGKDECSQIQRGSWRSCSRVYMTSDWGNDSPFSRTITGSIQPLTVLEWPRESPNLNPIEHLWRDLTMAVHRHFPSILAELEMICQEGWDKLLKSRWAKTSLNTNTRLNT